MNAIISTRRRWPGWSDWTVDRLLAPCTRRRGMAEAMKAVRVYRGVRIEFLPNGGRVEWRDGKRVTR
jgi:hypothetical protein